MLHPNDSPGLSLVVKNPSALDCPVDNVSLRPDDTGAHDHEGVQAEDDIDPHLLPSIATRDDLDSHINDVLYFTGCN